MMAPSKLADMAPGDVVVFRQRCTEASKARHGGPVTIRAWEMGLREARVRAHETGELVIVRTADLHVK